MRRDRRRPSLSAFDALPVCLTSRPVRFGSSRARARRPRSPPSEVSSGDGAARQRPVFPRSRSISKKLFSRSALESRAQRRQLVSRRRSASRASASLSPPRALPRRRGPSPPSARASSLASARWASRRAFPRRLRASGASVLLHLRAQRRTSARSTNARRSETRRRPVPGGLHLALAPAARRCPRSARHARRCPRARPARAPGRARSPRGGARARGARPRARWSSPGGAIAGVARGAPKTAGSGVRAASRGPLEAGRPQTPCRFARSRRSRDAHLGSRG